MALVLGLLALPAVAAASPVSFPLQLPAGTPAKFRQMVNGRIAPQGRRPGFRPTLVLRAQDGYLVGVIGFGTTVALEVGREGESAITAYLARGTVTRDRLQATFGQLGRVAVRFRPAKRRPRAGHRNCRGRDRFVNQRGVYVGTVRFRGEHDYVSVRAHRAKGNVRSLAPQCVRHRSPRGVLLAAHPSQNAPWGDELNALGASWRHAVDGAEYATLGGSRGSLSIAMTEHSEGPLAIVRIALALGNSSPIRINESLTTARVSPPAPFHGVGVYRAAPDGSTTWTGTLAVDFPGAQNYPLTGPPFEAELAAGL